MSFLDYQHAERIREALWSGRELGRAAVMVGAGVSLNGLARSPGIPAYPTWRDFTARLVDRLYPVEAAPNEHQAALEAAGATGGFLRIAQEYEASFGRAALDRAVIESIPDEDYEPANLHVRLLSLPWADVFTTNWDTLLERAARRVWGRKYNFVRVVREVAHGVRPRIVKLHGTLPSHSPFIVTEEDFRTYPRKFAPFVNTVQQALMENVFCLLGFSGDDPNFLYWSGWVRDHLGDNAPFIYFVTVAPLSHPRRQLLHERGVVPIDLTTIPGFGDWPPSGRRARALEWFVDFLAAGQPCDPMFWPDEYRSWVVPRTFLASPAKREKDSKIQPLDQVSEEEACGEVLAQTASWSIEREQYPGWIIAPHQVRSRVWVGTEYWLPRILNTLPKMGLEDRLNVLLELSWRLERSLVPLTGNVLEAIDGVLASLEPTQNVAMMSGVDASDDEASVDPTHAEAWVTLATARLRAARENLDIERFDALRARLWHMRNEVPELQDVLAYESCLLALSSFDSKVLTDILEHWDVSDGDPAWQIRKAGVLAELGRDTEAAELALQALNRIRERIRPERDDLPMLSREGWALHLLIGFDFHFRPSKAEIADQPDPFWLPEDAESRRRAARAISDAWGRWEALSRYRCDAWSERQWMESELDRPVPEPKPVVSEQPMFDPGMRMIWQHYPSGSDFDRQLLPALQAKRLVEEAGLPPIACRVALADRLLERTAAWLDGSYPEATLSIVLRAAGYGRENLTDWYFSRVRVARFTKVEFGRLFHWVKQAMEHILQRYSGSGPGGVGGSDREHYKFALSIELLSRLIIRQSTDTIEKTLRLGLEWYSWSVFQQTYSLIEPLAHLLERCVTALPHERIRLLLLELVELPVRGMKGCKPVDGRWPEPFDFLPSQINGAGIRDKDGDRWTAAIDKLIDAVGTVGPEPRGRSILRLFRLYSYGLLSEEEVRSSIEEIWRHRGADGVPVDFGTLLPWTLLLLPPPRGIDVQKVLRNAYIPIESSKRVRFEIIPCLVVDLRLRPEESQRLIVPTDNELERLTIALFSRGERLATTDDSFEPPNRLRDARKWLAAICSIVLPSFLKGGSSATKLVGLLERLEKAGLPTATAYPWLAALEPARADKWVGRLRQALVDPNPEQARTAVRAVFDWLTLEPICERCAPTPDLAREIGLIIASRRVSNLCESLECMTMLIQKHRNAVDDQSIELAVDGLRYLTDEADYGRPGSTSVFPEHKIPEIRAAAARLVVALFECCSLHDETLERWLTEAKGDPLPEVGRAARGDL